MTLYRVVQEALTNAVRHSGATQCDVRITVACDQLRLEVNDDGQGLPHAGPACRGGLMGMAERLDMAGGQLSLLANTSGGLRLLAQIPIHGKTQANTEIQEAMA